MKPVEQIRRENLEALIREAGSAAKLSLLSDVPQPYISQVRRGAAQSPNNNKPRVMGNSVARRLEAKMGKPTGWMDADHGATNFPEDLSGREGQLVALFRLLAPGEQADLVTELTKRLRRHNPAPASDSDPASKH